MCKTVDEAHLLHYVTWRCRNTSISKVEDEREAREEVRIFLGVDCVLDLGITFVGVNGTA